MSGLAFHDYVPTDCHDNIRLAVEYWLSIHPNEGLPGRQHFDPVDIPELLPYVRLLEVIGDPPQFKVRVMGTRVAAFYGCDLTGYCCHEAFPAFRGSEEEAVMTAVVRTGQPEYCKGPPIFFPKNPTRTTNASRFPWPAMVGTSICC